MGEDIIKCGDKKHSCLTNDGSRVKMAKGLILSRRNLLALPTLKRLARILFFGTAITFRPDGPAPLSAFQKGF
jgi:hypothetical protein